MKSLLDDMWMINRMAGRLPPNEKEDMVNHPNHYNGHKIKTSNGEFEYETIDLIMSVVNRFQKVGMSADVAYCVGSAVKYIDRCGEKAGDYGKDQKQKEAEDLKKAAWYLTKAAENLEK